ncbi:alpha-amylase family glycosyl hydrolase [uncultured Algibacter sp.]|uniref:alpha-amylase family glycosyl hydrolase n=1 Tax=uncultured Algibacter sp. TaxID=298659 RepID=UPI002629F675|nr:alpha-amylase family glycosyl hydrolase [uncultured Algibacter sp.]
MKLIKHIFIVLMVVGLSCEEEKKVVVRTSEGVKTTKKKMVVYQVFTRLFGNTNTINKAWGTIEENGVGKFNDFTETALKEIKDLGVSHIWYTGILHHAVINDYTKYGISNDDPDVVKGRAGSPYAVKDYYNVNPDLAVNVDNRLVEFQALIKRTHRIGLKVIIDIVPNHVARNYKSISKPKGVKDFGEEDDVSLAYHVNNNFYYNPEEAFKVPVWKDGYLPLGGEQAILQDDVFPEQPAKWTGNGSRLSQPDMNDWYETVKVNYGVSPDGKKGFDELPERFQNENYKNHFKFWKDKKVPNSWIKFRDIALYWLDMGIDGFRYDMAEMVPVEFWSFMNSSIKMQNPEAFLLAEVYNPSLYRDYIRKGKMDYLYDKVQLYDTIKSVMQGKGKTDNIPPILDDLKDIEHHMLHFLENHDEQRLASPGFAGNADKGKPAMVVSATSSTSPTMVYFGQEVGEDGSEDAGFGAPTRTSIFDYVGIPAYQRWVNNKQFDGGQLTDSEKALRDFYKRLLNFSLNSSALVGDYQDIHEYNREHTENYNDKVLSFVRWSDKERLIIVSNFDDEKGYELELKIPENVIRKWALGNKSFKVVDQLYHDFNGNLQIEKGTGTIRLKLGVLESFILKIQ